MRLYLTAESEKSISYIPDWLKVRFTENDQSLELTLDITGEIDYSEDKLDCRCKVDAIPWTLYNLESGEETDLSLLSALELDRLFPLEKVAEIIYNSETYRIGLYPVNDSEETFELAKEDTFTNCEGCIEIFNGFTVYKKQFEFEAEVNV